MNASGLPDENHYSTAHDMALIMREGLKNKKFRKKINFEKMKMTSKGQMKESGFWRSFFVQKKF